MRKILHNAFGLVLIIVLLMSLSCQKEKLVTSTTDAVNMTSYFKEHPEEFSELTKVLQLSETASFLNAYGSYTFFAPTNTAIKAYLQSKGKNSVEDIGALEWKNLIRFHILEDSLGTEQFTDGKLPDTTMYGQYLVSGAYNANGETKFRINRQADIIKANISVGNGIVHVINNVLIPATKTLGQQIEENPRYSIFTQALKETGLFDSLNFAPSANPIRARAWLTVIAESDSVIQAKGFANFAALKARYSKSGDPKLPADSLHLWVDYHILYNAKYLADILTSNAHNTLAPQEVLTSKLSGEDVLINDDEFNGIPEPGFSLFRHRSDVTATNGVLHEASAHFAIKLRSPYAVYHDVCDIPGMRKLTQYYGKANYEFKNYSEVEALDDIKFSASTDKLIYRFGSGQSTSKTSHKEDVFVCPIGTSSRPVWVEFRSPLLIKGKYKIWIGYYTQSQGTNFLTEVQTSVRKDGTDSLIQLSNSRTLNFTIKRPGQAADVEEAIGWKTYMENTSGSQVARLVGIADIKETGRYWIRLTAINGSQNTNNIDMIHLIPINMDQQYPKFKPNGDRILRP